MTLLNADGTPTPKNVAVSAELPKKQTAGEKVQEFLSKQTSSAEAGETLQPMFKDLEKIILDIMEKNRLLSEYYIVTQTDKEPWLGNATRLRTWWRRTRPSPQVKQDVYKVTNGKLEPLWSIPFRENCESICRNPSAYDPQLAGWVISFVKGELK